MEQYDLLIKNVNIYRGRGLLEENLDIGITGNLFKSIRRNIPSNEAKTVIDGKGRLASPSFMDTHMHIDEAFTMDNDNTLSLLAAIDNQNKSTAKYFDWSDEQIMDMILSNSSRVVEMCVKNGTGLLKTNVLFTPAWKTIALEAMMVLRERYRDLIDIRTCVSFPASFAIELEKAAGEGKVDFISGYPYMDD
jgi:cytosine/adenosine deaminase-related metal-dependent hydrolase